METVAAIILAAGSSTRMSRDKVWADLGGAPLFLRAVRVFAASADVHDVVLVVRSGQEAAATERLAAAGLSVRVVTGGVERQDSVRAGLEATPEADWVIIHDAARPLVTPDLVERGLETARSTGAAIAAIPAVDTIKVVADDRVTNTLDRAALWHAQTPQIFRRSLLVAAHRSAGAVATDDAALVEATGASVRVFLGAYTNLKVTTDHDLLVARTLLAAVEAGGGPGSPRGAETRLS